MTDLIHPAYYCPATQHIHPEDDHAMGDPSATRQIVRDTDSGRRVRHDLCLLETTEACERNGILPTEWTVLYRCHDKNGVFGGIAITSNLGLRINVVNDTPPIQFLNDGKAEDRTVRMNNIIRLLHPEDRFFMWDAPLHHPQISNYRAVLHVEVPP